MKMYATAFVLAAALLINAAPAHAMGKRNVAPPVPVPPSAPAPVPVPVRPTVETTLQGATFTRIDGTYPSMTEAWRDPDGRVWAFQFKEGLDRYVDAVQFCSSYGLRLPTEQEYDRLRGEMGYGTPAGYSPQAFILYAQINYPNAGSNYFWTSTVQDSCGVTIFGTENGYTYRGATDERSYGVICVSQ